MQKKVKIGYDESSKAVTAHVEIEYSGDGVPSNEETLKEVQALFDLAEKYSVAKTMRKV